MNNQEEIIIQSTQDLYTAFEKPWFALNNNEHGKQVWKVPVAYRGMKNIEWELKSTIGRISHYSLELEKEMLFLFKTRARPYIKDFPKNEWEWLTLAQHHGLPTRLLDWTRNPLVATYFAVEDESETDSVIYGIFSPLYLNVEKFNNPLEYKNDLIVFCPENLTSRVIAQQGLFTIHSSPNEPFNKWKMKIVIPNKLRKLIKQILFGWGIGRETLFPDLDGLTSSIKYWTTEDKDLSAYGLQ